MIDTIPEVKIVCNDSLKLTNHVIKIINESGDNSHFTTNIITIVLALIAGLIALYQVKSNIISSSRIAWIENLREAISTYVAEVSECSVIIANMHSTLKGKTGEDFEKTLNIHYPKYSDSSKAIDKFGSKVLLYLNPQEESHKRIEDLIEGISDHLHKKKMAELDRDKIDTDLKKIITISKEIFKKEWTKSKGLFRI
jgi:hypothetical protein